MTKTLCSLLSLVATGSLAAFLYSGTPQADESSGGTETLDLTQTNLDPHGFVIPHGEYLQIAQESGTKKKGKVSAANTFNRLLKRPSAASNAPPAEDGIHDPDNSGTHLLQWPSEAFEGLPKSNDGNKVDWVGALRDGVIAPWYDIEDPPGEPFLMDLVIVREVKGSMPDVVYPHEPHTEWLDCTNCHDDIFVPEKGANQISMAAILLGQKCGVCHGKIAFPVTDCRRCHAKPKTEEQLRALAEKSSWRKSGTAATTQ
jgi:c(7)-type cytochrome triheme protein